MMRIRWKWTGGRHMTRNANAEKMVDENDKTEGITGIMGGRNGRRRSIYVNAPNLTPKHPTPADLQKTTFPQMQLQKDILNSAQDDWCSYRKQIRVRESENKECPAQTPTICEDR